MGERLIIIHLPNASCFKFIYCTLELQTTDGKDMNRQIKIKGSR